MLGRIPEIPDPIQIFPFPFCLGLDPRSLSRATFPLLWEQRARPDAGKITGRGFLFIFFGLGSDFASDGSPLSRRGNQSEIFTFFPFGRREGGRKEGKEEGGMVERV